MARADERHRCEREANPTATDTPAREAGRTARLPPGATVGRYVVLACVGEGGMGVVYSAHDFALDRRVSLKLVRSGQGSQAEVRRARLLGEAQALARVAHPNVVAVHDVGTLGDEVYVALEHVPGLTLGDWLRGSPRSPRAVCDVFAQAGRGLAAVHAAGLVHRDVKPDNLLLGEDGRVRLADFGLAVSAGDGGDASAGTPGYMPLEQLRGEPVDARADQFAFAVALFEALTGERPYGPRGASRAALTARLLHGPPATVPYLRGAPSGLRRSLGRALSPEAVDRHPSMDALVEALEGRRSSARAPAARQVGLGALAAAFVALLATSAQLSGPGQVLTTEQPAPPAAHGGEVRLASSPRTRPTDRASDRARAVAAESTGQAALAGPVPIEAAPVGAAAAPLASSVAAPGRSLGAPESSRQSAPGAVGPAAFPATNPLLDALADALEALIKSLRATLDAETSTMWAGGVPLVPLPTADHGRSSAPAATGGSNSGVELDGSSLRIAALQQQLDQRLASGASPTDIATARFALAQAMAGDPTQQSGAIALAEQAQADLERAGSDAASEALRLRVHDWIVAHQSNRGSLPTGGGRMVDAQDRRSLETP